MAVSVAASARPDQGVGAGAPPTSRAEIDRRAERARLIVCNLVNGVPGPVVAAAFQLSVVEVDAVFADVLHKIRCYMRDRNIIGFEQLIGLAEAKRDRLVVLHVLSRLGPQYLAGPAKYKRFVTQALDDRFLKQSGLIA